MYQKSVGITQKTFVSLVFLKGWSVLGCFQIAFPIRLLRFSFDDSHGFLRSRCDAQKYCKILVTISSAETGLKTFSPEPKKSSPACNELPNSTQRRATAQIACATQTTRCCLTYQRRDEMHAALQDPNPQLHTHYHTNTLTRTPNAKIYGQAVNKYAFSNPV